MTYNLNLEYVLSSVPTLYGVRPFTNAYFGKQVADNIFGVFCMVTNAYQAEKAAEKQADLDMDAELRSIDKEIKELEKSKPEDKISESYQKNIDNATTRRDDVNKQINTLEKKEPRDDADDELLNKLRGELTTLNGDANTKGSIEYYKQKQIDELARLEQAKKDKLTELKEKRAKLENQINNRDLEKLSKKVKKGSDNDLTDKIDENGKLKGNNTFDVTDFNTAVHRLKNSTRGSEERYKNAKLVSYIYKKLPEIDKNSSHKKCAEIAEEEIRQYEKEQQKTGAKKS